jgi:hypothetical protein
MKSTPRLALVAFAFVLCSSAVPKVFGEEPASLAAGSQSKSSGSSVPGKTVGEVSKDGGTETSEEVGGIMGQDGACAPKDEPVSSTVEETKSSTSQPVSIRRFFQQATVQLTVQHCRCVLVIAMHA